MNRFGASGGGKELKFHDVAVTNGPIDSTLELAPAIGQLCTVVQGITQSQRIGRKITIKSIQIRGFLRFNPGTADHASDLVHVWLVVDKQTNGAALTGANVFTGTTASVAMRNMEYVSRFTVLKHWVWRFQPTGTNIAGTEHNDIVQLWEDYLKVNIPIEYSSTTGDVAEIRHNNICLMWGSTETDDKVEMTCRFRLRYADN